MATTLSRSTRNKIASLHAQVKALVRSGKRPTAADRKQLKQRAHQTLAAITKINKSFVPADPVERALADKIRKSPKARAGVRALLKKSSVTPADYYELLYKVVGDLKLLGMHKPNVMHKLYRKQRGGMAPADSCECSACEACTICAVCELSVVEAVGATGMVGATVSTLVSGNGGS